MRIGFGVGGFMIFLLMLFFGIMGMIAYARDRESYDNFMKLGYLSIFDLIRNLPQFWHYVTLILLTTLAASSIDTLQNALASVLSHDLDQAQALAELVSTSRDCFEYWRGHHG